jgi:S-DNA-T family DNA segregation ATPase FtsK/SpoIIIE
MSDIRAAFHVFGSSERVPLLPEEWDGWPQALRVTALRLFSRVLGLSCIVAAIATTIALITHNASDPSWNNASDGAVSNAIGSWGAIVSDLLFQSFGAAAWPVTLPVLAWGLWLVDGRIGLKLILRVVAWALAITALAAFLALFPPLMNTGSNVPFGGVGGELALSGIARGVAALGLPTAKAVGGITAGAVGFFLFFFALGFNPLKLTLPVLPWDAIGNVISRVFGFVTAPLGALLRKRPKIARVRREPMIDGADDLPIADEDEDDEAAEHAPLSDTMGRIEPRIMRADKKKPGIREKREAQPKLSIIDPDDYELPPLTLLEKNKTTGGPRESDEALEQNARQLVSVLADFGVRGQITQVRPGPVVTLYELEPAAGIRSSRVISLADDIARSMSAVSARVAAIPGRNVIGIELPNQRREKVVLRDLLATNDYENTHAQLVLALGKNIGGEPVIADLARMPHLLIAGTTGSGKSVAINTMILSLLYRMPPSQCKLIMIDPKMLELSAYDGIPHLLSPVVTDPKKAIVALKWTVREMEDRYRRMSKLGVRNIMGFNERIARAAAKKETLSRTVQTGFDKESGEPIYETETIELSHMPYIVVIVDEMADLMMVAGKEIEAAVQRLAQMARAAGIHIIMATQRPSVDVITGTIKANFPTRISFQVTSKIDSRTILGEPGAEQLLGQGDMLYMEGGGRIRRVHGPFVSDDEVEAVVKFLKAQGEPSYLDAITEEPEEADPLSLLDGEGEGSGDDLYDQAVAIVARDKKASTSYIQRRLQIGYNRAARIIEKMEEQGVVSSPNHSGKREVLVGDHSGHPRDD